MPRDHKPEGYVDSKKMRSVVVHCSGNLLIYLFHKIPDT